MNPTRRTFLASAAAAATFANPARAQSGGETVTIGIMGTGGRGTDLAGLFAKQEGVKIGYLCDVDESHYAKAAAAVEKITGTAPKGIIDYRTLLDDKTVDALIVATPNHWHAPAAILGCKAGKHVYVEKPCSHNPREGEILVEAAQKYKRHVQMGNQRRSYPHFAEAIKLLHDQVIGRTYLAKSWYFNSRPSIGRGKAVELPKGFDYAGWQGPAPVKPFRDNYLPYSWHWFWHWGNGELGNNGVHTIDICRWGLGVEYPIRALSSGGRYRFDDDQETPDTNTVCFEFEGKKQITWECMSCNIPPGGNKFEIHFFGDKGSLVLRDNGYSIYDVKGKEIKKVDGSSSVSAHLANFLTAVRHDQKLNSEITEGHKTTLLCHLGNISYRTGRAIKCDPKTGHIVGDKEAEAFWSREYAPGWEEKLKV